MSRLIDADKLNEWFSKYFNDGDKVDAREIHEVIDNALTQMQWISVEDRLPERNKTVLVHVVGSDWDEPDSYISTDKLLPEGLWAIYHLSVTHWMPLPEPPEEHEGS